MSIKAKVMIDCEVCAEKYNKSNKNPIECGLCEFTACRACYKQYIPSLSEGVKCMSCKKDWDRSFIYSNFDKLYINTTLKNRRENILIDRELTLMAETQIAVEKIKLNRKLQNEINEYEEQQRIINIKIRRLYREKQDKLTEFDNEHSIIVGINNRNSQNNIKLIKKCTFENCKGFLSSVWKCGLCTNWTCPECFEIRGTEKNADHVCNPDNIETAKLIKSDTRSCPNCSEGIYKIEGCSQMWCTSCKTPFDWNTGKIITGNVHNPHYFEWRRNNNNYEINLQDIICEREINNYFVNRFYHSPRQNIPELKQYETIVGKIIRKVIEFKDYQIHNINVNIIGENRLLRISYLLDEITEEQLKTLLQRKEKGICKRGELTNIYTMFVQCATDIFYRLIDSIYSIEISTEQIIEIYKEIINEMTSLKEYTNTHLTKIGKIYNSSSSIKLFNDEYNFIH